MTGSKAARIAHDLYDEDKAKNYAKAKKSTPTKRWDRGPYNPDTRNIPMSLTSAMLRQYPKMLPEDVVPMSAKDREIIELLSKHYGK